MDTAALALPQEVFATVVRHAPLVSIDLIVRDPAGALLLGRRVNRPAQGFWFVPGGRVRKGESLDDAFARIACDELGAALRRADCRFTGVYEHMYPDHFGGADFGTHYVVLAYEVQMAPAALRLPTVQHEAYVWLGAEEMRRRDDVHGYTKAYA
jgi:colanic acid biosynthesis protein WcaH